MDDSKEDKRIVVQHLKEATIAFQQKRTGLAPVPADNCCGNGKGEQVGQSCRYGRLKNRWWLSGQ